LLLRIITKCKKGSLALYVGSGWSIRSRAFKEPSVFAYFFGNKTERSLKMWQR